jgi:hypothetical protein
VSLPEDPLKRGLSSVEDVPRGFLMRLALGEMARPAFSEAEVRFARRNLDRILADAAAERVLPGVARALMAVGIGEGSRPVSRLKEAAERAAEQQVAYTADIAAVMPLLADRAVVAKGFAMQALYGPNLVRSFGDVDVVTDNVRTAWGIARRLRGIGYEASAALFARRVGSRSIQLDMQLHHRVEGGRSWGLNAGGFPITAYSCLPLALDRRRESEVAGLKVPTPNVEDTLLVLAAEIYSRHRHLWLRDELDAAIFLSSSREQCHWDHLRQRARAVGIEPAVSTLISAGNAVLRHVGRSDMMPAEERSATGSWRPRFERWRHSVTGSHPAGRVPTVWRNVRFEAEAWMFDRPRWAPPLHRITQRRNCFNVFAAGGGMYLVPIAGASNMDLDAEALLTACDTPPAIGDREWALVGWWSDGLPLVATPIGIFLASLDALVSDDDRDRAIRAVQPALVRYRRRHPGMYRSEPPDQ